MLENQCRTWTDPLAAVVYVPLFRNASGGTPIIPTYRNTTLEDVIRGMDAFHQFMESTAQCALHMELVGQFLDPLEPEEYPINSLRNRAMRMATTELVFLLDVDFVTSPLLGLPEPGYRDAAVYDQMVELTGRRRAMVLPAFEITNRKQDLVLAQNFARNMVVGEPPRDACNLLARCAARGRCIACPRPAHPLASRAWPRRCRPRAAPAHVGT
jgi:hypothetical protein